MGQSVVATAGLCVVLIDFENSNLLRPQPLGRPSKNLTSSTDDLITFWIKLIEMSPDIVSPHEILSIFFAIHLAPGMKIRIPFIPVNVLDYITQPSTYLIKMAQQPIFHI